MLLGFLEWVCFAVLQIRRAGGGVQTPHSIDCIRFLRGIRFAKTLAQMTALGRAADDCRNEIWK
jgi:hypothetical protein